MRIFEINTKTSNSWNNYLISPMLKCVVLIHLQNFIYKIKSLKLLAGINQMHIIALPHNHINIAVFPAADTGSPVQEIRGN